MDVEGRPPVFAWPAWDLAADPRGRHRVDQPGSDTEDHSVCPPRQHDPQPLADHRRTLTAETMESPVLSNGHAGFGERPGETDRRQHRHRAPGRLNRTEPGTETEQWIGHTCVTSSGKHAVVVYAPRQVVNDEDRYHHGALAAVVDLDSGVVTKLPEPVSIAYYNPGCGTDERAILTQNFT